MIQAGILPEVLPGLYTHPAISLGRTSARCRSPAGSSRRQVGQVSNENDPTSTSTTISDLPD